MDVFKALLGSISTDDVASFMSIVKANPDSMKEPFPGLNENLFHYCAREGKVEFCQALLSMGYEIDSSITHKTTPLSSAVNSGSLELIKWFIKNGASIDSLEKAVDTPLMGAITLGKDDIAKYLIGEGADTSRLHLRYNQTALDLAIIWGRKEVEDLLRQTGARAVAEEHDWSKEYGGSIIQYVNDTVGRVLPVSLTSIVSIKNQITQRVALVNKGKNKLLFTVGLFALHQPMLELFIVLSAEWNMNDSNPENQFPSALLMTLSKNIQTGAGYREGDLILSTDYPNLSWPKSISGFCLVDHNWGREESADNDMTGDDAVHLYTLVPLKKMVGGVDSSFIQKLSEEKWSKLALKL